MDTPIAGHNGVQQACLYKIDVLLHRVYALLMKLLQSWRDFRDSVTSEFTIGSVDDSSCIMRATMIQNFTAPRKVSEGLSQVGTVNAIYNR